MSNKAHTNDMVEMQQKQEHQLARYEELIRKQGAYLIELSRMIREGATKKELKNFVDKFGIGK